MIKNYFFYKLSITLCGIIFSGIALCQQSDAKTNGLILFQNVSIFDGKSNNLKKNYFVLVRGNQIEKVSSKKPPIKPTESATIVNGEGGVLMPGLIDNHWHAMLVAASPQQVVFGDPSLTAIIAANESEKTLMRGFTSARDMAGSVF